ncbi:DUF4160 domain-containing protein [Nitrospira sp. M1]
MPVISMFYGLIVRMYFFDTQKHKAPHVHVQYGEQRVVLGIPECDVLSGELKANKLKLVQAWIEIHQEELLADWQLAIEGQKVFTIAPLR